MSKQQHSESASENDKQQQEQEQEQYDPLANLLSLQLSKPARWNWELSTSRSCSNIALPRILLYDHTGALLLDADGRSERTYRERRRKRSNLDQRLPSKFHGLHIAEATPSDTSAPASPSLSRQLPLAGSCIDFSTHELPDWQPRESSSSRRSVSLRGVRFEEQDERPRERSQELAYPTPPSTSTLTSSSGPREKRRYRRSHSSGQRSILERFSMSRGRHSSPEYVQEQTLERAPRYFLRSSKAGTLVIQDESFSRVRQRRRHHRHSSSLNEAAAEGVVQVAARRGDQQPLLSTSEEEEQLLAQVQAQGQAATQPRCRRSQRNCAKDIPAQDLITVDPGNCVYRAAPGATAR